MTAAKRVASRPIRGQPVAPARASPPEPVAPQPLLRTLKPPPAPTWEEVARLWGHAFRSELRACKGRRRLPGLSFPQCSFHERREGSPNASRQEKKKSGERLASALRQAGSQHSRKARPLTSNPNNLGPALEGRGRHPCSCRRVARPGANKPD